ncbi:glucose oxidase [Xylariales sp. AK1849]|nr:glucose oxidase [Xylariales sp. AK1849]
MRTASRLLLLVLGFLARNETFDYVIAGAGTAEVVVANRLSENSGISVAVIEPGDDVRDNPNVTTVGSQALSFNASIDWQYISTPQPQLGNRTIVYHAGKAIGITGTITGMTYIRGDKAQYDAWEALGNEGWNWDTLLPYFKSSENLTLPTGVQTAAAGPSFNTFRQTWEAWGILHNSDVDVGHTRGFTVHPETLDQDANSREHAARAYYYPVENRANLKIIKETVRRLMWKDHDYQVVVADGVEYLDPSGAPVSIKVSKEVVLSTGSWRSPLILESSGVGKSKVDILDSLSIETKEFCGNSYTSPTDFTGQLRPYAAFATAQDLFGDETTAVAASTTTNLSILARATSAASNGAINTEAPEARFRIQHDFLFNKNVTISESIIPNLVPFSLGSTYLSAEFDLNVLVRAGRLSSKLWHTKPLSDLIDSSADASLPRNATDAEWTSYIRKTVSTVWHAIGTCVMMPRELGGVVDPKVRVYGTRNVRIVDAFIIPVQMSGHPTATLYALAERASELIKDDW